MRMWSSYSYVALRRRRRPLRGFSSSVPGLPAWRGHSVVAVDNAHCSIARAFQTRPTCSRQSSGACAWRPQNRKAPEGPWCTGWLRRPGGCSSDLWPLPTCQLPWPRRTADWAQTGQCIEERGLAPRRRMAALRRRMGVNPHGVQPTIRSPPNDGPRRAVGEASGLSALAHPSRCGSRSASRYAA